MLSIGISKLRTSNTSNNKVIINGTYINNDGDKDIRINGTFFIEIDTKTEEVIYKLK